MKDLRNMSISEIIQQLDVYIYNYDFYSFINDENKAEEIKKEFTDLVTSTKYNLENIVDFFKKYEQYIDKEKFVLVQWYRMQNANSKEKKEKGFNEIIAIAKKMLKGSNVAIAISDDSEKINIINVDILEGKTKSSKNLERLNIITEDIPIRLFTAGLDIDDLEEFICANKSMGRTIGAYIQYNAVKSVKDRGVQSKDANDLIAKDEFKKELTEQFEKAIFEYSQYINIDKMILASIYRYLDRLDKGLYDIKITNESQALLSDMFKFVNKNTNIKAKMNLECNDRKVETIEVSTSAKEIKSKLEYNFINGIYYGDCKLEKIKKEIYEDGAPLEHYDPRIIPLLDFESEEILQLLDNDDNFKYVVIFGLLSDDDIKEVLYDKQNLSANMYEYLLNEGKIDKQFILDLYTYGNISLDTLRELKNKEYLNIEEIAKEDELIRLYRSFTRHDKHEEEFNEYLALYKELKVKDNDIETRKENANKLIENLGEIFEEEDLKKMYTLGMIPVDTAIEWGGESITQDMFNSGTLRPIDSKRLYRNNTLTLDMIKQVLKSEELSDGDKMALICSTFDSDEHINIRMELIQYIYLDEKSQKSSSKGIKNTGLKSEHENTIKSKNEYITDPCSRWKLISLIDEDYSQQICKDGYIIFELPNFKNGTIVIEKMFKKYQGRNIPSYGNATYVLSKEEFDKSEKYVVEENLVGDKKVNLGELAQLKEEGKADKLNHSSKWGNNIKKYFKIGKGSIYSKEQITEIDRTIKSIENSRELR